MRQTEGTRRKESGEGGAGKKQCVFRRGAERKGRKRERILVCFLSL